MKKNFICKFIVSGSLFFFSLGMFAQRVSADLLGRCVWWNLR